MFLPRFCQEIKKQVKINAEKYRIKPKIKQAE